MIQSIKTKMTPYVRVENNPYIINKCLDAGAEGIIIPNVNNNDDVIKAVEAIKYPPIGKRSCGLCNAQNYGEIFDSYFKDFNKKVKIIIQIETKEGFYNSKDIISNEHINGYMVGPYDLSASMGITKEEMDNGKLLKMEKSLISIAKKYGKYAGYHIVHPSKKLIDEKIKLGYDFIVIGVDNVLLLSKYKEIEEMIL
jgi:2-dehydro-3-deoxyglucarate aldolase